MTEKTKLIRSIYLYLASIVSLLFVAIGVYTIFNTALKYYVLPRAEKGGYSRCNQEPLAYSRANPEKSGVANEEQEAQTKQMSEDYEKWKAENSGEACYSAERQNNIANSLTMIIVALPIFLFHWRMVKKEKEEKEN